MIMILPDFVNGSKAFHTGAIMTGSKYIARGTVCFSLPLSPPIPALSLRQRHFSSTPHFRIQNRIYDPIRIPPTFHDYLRTCSASNTLMLTLFTSSVCTPCRTITPLLETLIRSRTPIPQDKYGSLAFAEVELDSPDNSNGSMMDLGVEYGITSLPTLVGFGGRRAERVTERLIDTKMMCDKTQMEEWVNEQMAKGDSYGSTGSRGILARIFG